MCTVSAKSQHSLLQYLVREGEPQAEPTPGLSVSMPLLLDLAPRATRRPAAALRAHGTRVAGVRRGAPASHSTLAP